VALSGFVLLCLHVSIHEVLRCCRRKTERLRPDAKRKEFQA